MAKTRILSAQYRAETKLISKYYNFFYCSTDEKPANNRCFCDSASGFSAKGGSIQIIKDARGGQSETDILCHSLFVDWLIPLLRVLDVSGILSKLSACDADIPKHKFNESAKLGHYPFSASLNKKIKNLFYLEIFSFTFRPPPIFIF